MLLLAHLILQKQVLLRHLNYETFLKLRFHTLTYMFNFISIDPVLSDSHSKSASGDSDSRRHTSHLFTPSSQISIKNKAKQTHKSNRGAQAQKLQQQSKFKNIFENLTSSPSSPPPPPPASSPTFPIRTATRTKSSPASSKSHSTLRPASLTEKFFDHSQASPISSSGLSSLQSPFAFPSPSPKLKSSPISATSASPSAPAHAGATATGGLSPAAPSTPPQPKLKPFGTPWPRNSSSPSSIASPNPPAAISGQTRTGPSSTPERTAFPANSLGGSRRAQSKH